MNLFSKIKLLWKVRKPISSIIKEVKKMKNEPGRKTTEFILVIISELIVVVGALGKIIPPETAAIIIATLTGVYNILRTLRKNSADKVAIAEAEKSK